MMLALPDPTSHAEAVARIKAIRARQEAAGRRIAEERHAQLRVEAEARRAERRAIDPVRALISEVAEAHGLTYCDILGEDRTTRVCRVRHQAVAAVAAEWPDMTVSELGRIFDGRDRKTILHALRAIHGQDYRHETLPNGDKP